MGMPQVLCLHPINGIGIQKAENKYLGSDHKQHIEHWLQKENVNCKQLDV